MRTRSKNVNSKQSQVAHTKTTLKTKLSENESVLRRLLPIGRSFDVITRTLFLGDVRGSD